jgi:uncharacterized protein YbjT (DUF2867 family)
MVEYLDPSERLVTVFGGSGFVGRHIIRAFARRGWRVRAAVRRPDLANFLQPIGGVGQVQSVQANLRYPESVVAAVAGARIVMSRARAPSPPRPRRAGPISSFTFPASASIPPPRTPTSPARRGRKRRRWRPSRARRSCARP